ncbi:MAG: OB-fold nucleic acid binding domain-containing protein [Candidatus Aenigmatarchaeota archaeon]
MKISELKEGQRNVNLIAKIVKKDSEKVVETKFGKRRVCNFEIEDESGKITLVLWEDDIDAFDVGDKVQITNGFVTQFKGKLQLSIGRFGKISKI